MEPTLVALESQGRKEGIVAKGLRQGIAEGKSCESLMRRHGEGTHFNNSVFSLY
jgi:hypothetical protein